MRESHKISPDPWEMVAQLRGHLGLTQQELGQMIQRSDTTISAIEAGQRQPTDTVKVRIQQLAAEHGFSIPASSWLERIAP